jgi:hypothetical protein
MAGVNAPTKGRFRYKTINLLRLKAFAAVVLLYKSFWSFTQRRGLVQSSGSQCDPEHSLDHTETLMMGHTSSLETLVPDQTTTPGKTPKTVMYCFYSLRFHNFIASLCRS